ncbi:MAG: diphthine--ammonia ligase [Nanobdellota archaeon]
MCGIIGVFGKGNAFEIVNEGIEKIKNRGRDNKAYFDGAGVKNFDKRTFSKNIIAHNLHSIVGNVRQPLFEQGHALVSNCEIYNWAELCEKFNLSAKNDSELLLKLIIKIGLFAALKQLRGVYSFALWKNNMVYLVRDLIGVKPLWYSQESGFGFCSEKKGLLKYFSSVAELNPRNIIEFNLETYQMNLIEREFVKTQPVVSNEKYALDKLEKLLRDAVSCRIPDKKFGLLFSGGIDSVIIAKILKDLGYEFNCYVAGTSKDSLDVVQAKSAANDLGLNLKTRIIGFNHIKPFLKRTIDLIEDTNVCKVGVALPIMLSSELASEDGIKVIFSGSGADEIFAGYNRYKKSNQINQDCYSDILKIYEKNTYRDDCVTMNNCLELRVPFLDLNVVSFGLSLLPELKINDIDKYMLRRLAVRLGISTEIAERKKKAAQYASGFDKLINQLSKQKNMKKSEYLAGFRDINLKLGALLSGGKDSLFAAYIMKKQNYELTCAITMESENTSSYMFHTPNINMAKVQGECIGIPVIVGKTHGEKEKELDDLYKVIKTAKEKYKIDGIITGAIFSNYQRERIEKVCDSLGLKIFSPLWHMDQEQEMRQLLNEGFTFIFSSIACFGLDESWLGRKIVLDDVKKLVDLNTKYGINVAGEGGEFESLVLDCPLFNKRIEIIDSEIRKENENTALFDVLQAKTYKK